MNRNYLCIDRKIILLLSIGFILIIFFFYQNFLIKSQPHPFVPPIYINQRHILNTNVTLKKISIAHYTKLYGTRTDSHTSSFNDNLKPICQILDPEDYLLADSVFFSVVDFVRLPVSYRNLHQSQLWIFYSEESPRNSYGKFKMKDIKDLDDWFNLTSTLKPESDFHIQYRVCLNEVNKKLNLGARCFIYPRAEISHKI